MTLLSAPTRGDLLPAALWCYNMTQNIARDSSSRRTHKRQLKTNSNGAWCAPCCLKVEDRSLLWGERENSAESSEFEKRLKWQHIRFAIVLWLTTAQSELIKYASAPYAKYLSDSLASTNWYLATMWYWRKVLKFADLAFKIGNRNWVFQDRNWIQWMYASKPH